MAAPTPLRVAAAFLCSPFAGGAADATRTAPGMAAESSLRLVRTVPLPGVSGRFDHFACDVPGKRLFVAALGHNTVEVVDLSTFARLQSIRGLRKPTGVLYLPEVGRLYVANGDDGTFRAFDGRTLAPLSQLASVDDADNVRFDADAKRIYLGFGDGALGVTDPMARTLSGRIELNGHPESFQVERTGSRIFVNVPDTNAIVVVDRRKQTIVARWPMSEFQANFPMALDEANRRLFVGCRRPARLVVFDTSSGRAVRDLEISGDTDDLFFDERRQRIYVSCGEGFVDVIQRSEGDHYTRIERVPTRPGARTSFLAPPLNLLFVAVPQRNGQEAELRVYQPD